MVGVIDRVHESTRERPRSWGCWGSQLCWIVSANGGWDTPDHNREEFSPERTSLWRTDRATTGVSNRYAAVLKFSMWRIQLVSRFHLGQIWATILRSRELTPKRELRLGKPREGCRAVASRSEGGPVPPGVDG
jgi:hypothetical protein